MDFPVSAQIEKIQLRRDSQVQKQKIWYKQTNIYDIERFYIDIICWDQNFILCRKIYFDRFSKFLRKFSEPKVFLKGNYKFGTFTFQCDSYWNGPLSTKSIRSLSTYFLRGSTSPLNSSSGSPYSIWFDWGFKLRIKILLKNESHDIIHVMIWIQIHEKDLHNQNRPFQQQFDSPHKVIHRIHHIDPIGFWINKIFSWFVENKSN